MSAPKPHINDQNRQIIEQFRANGGRSTGGGEESIVLLTHTGRKSGRSYTNPLACVADGDDLIIAGTKGGTPTHPEWYLNLVANPIVTVEWDGQKYSAEAQTVPASPERDRLIGLLSVALPKLPRYEEKTAGVREIPIIRLIRNAD
ncbi:nitroreductase/quinone reductase family protein [Jatrophihabitans sp. DSM 45814]